MSRIKNTSKNISVALIGQTMSVLVSFITRTYFISILSVEYLGINGLFSNILKMLSLVELGIGPAIVFSLYKPLAENKWGKVKAIALLYKKIYVIIGSVIAGIGFFMSMFIEMFIGEVRGIGNIKLIFLLFVVNSSISYFYSYKRSLLIADQKSYIVTVYKYTFFTMLNVTQIIFLYITRSYIVFLVIQILFTILENIYVSRRADKIYPILTEGTKSIVDIETKKEIYKNASAMLCHKIGGIVVNATDNIIIAKFINIVSVGVYSNYQLIIHAVNVIVSQIFTSITASVGNLKCKEGIDKTESVFYVTFFMNFYVYGFCAISIFILINDFISIWLGESLILDNSIVLVLIINFYITGMRKSVLIFRNALGLFWYDRYKPIIEAITNIIISILLVQKCGLIGVFIGTFVSSFFICFWVEPYVLFKYGFKKKTTEYFCRFLKYTLVTGISGVFAWGVNRLIIGEGIVFFIIRVILTAIIINSIFIISFRKTEEFARLKSIAQRFCSKSFKKITKKS